MSGEQSTNTLVIAGNAPTLAEVFSISVTPDGLLRLSTWAHMPALPGVAPAAGPGLVMTLRAADNLAGLLRSEVNKAMGARAAN